MNLAVACPQAGVQVGRPKSLDAELLCDEETQPRQIVLEEAWASRLLLGKNEHESETT